MARVEQVAVPVPCEKCGYYLSPSASGPLNFCPACGEDLRTGDPQRTFKNALIGQVVADRYRLLKLVGEGGMGAVFKAEHIRMGKALALKILRGDFAGDPTAVERFKAEARIVSRLSHPHTIAVFDFGEIEGSEALYLAMEYVPGKDLAHILREVGKLPEASAVRIGQQMLGSLAEAHEAGIVHRDMKPANVMLMQARPGEDFVKVLDFGIAKFREDHTTDSSSGVIMGTPNYLAPEQARGDEVDARADLYAVGCVLYELCAGQPPFTASNPLAVVSAHLNEEPPPLERMAPEVSVRYAEIVHRALQKDPVNRFASADEMRNALLALDHSPGYGVGVDTSVHQVTDELEIANRDDFREFERQLLAMKRSRTVGPVIAALVVALSVGLVVGWPGLYGVIALRAPELAASVPAALRPGSVYDGREHEPNNVPAQANRLPLPPGPDGQPAGGVAVMRGYIGAKLSEDTGDVDIFRIEVPEGVEHRTLVADWHGEKPGDGIRGLDVSLSLNREGSGRDSQTAPLVAAVNRGGPGRPETLYAPVEPGVYFLAVREVHREATGPVEKPTDPYVLEVRLMVPAPGQEVEPNDEPDKSSPYSRYVEWRGLAERNPIREGAWVFGDTSPEDWDTWGIVPGEAGKGPFLLVAVPTQDLALDARLWTPDQKDLEPPSPPVDRVRWRSLGQAGPGTVLVAKLPDVQARSALVLFALRAASGRGGYELIALGEKDTSREVLARFEKLKQEGRDATALELVAAYAGLPQRVLRPEILTAAGALAKTVAERLDPAHLVAYEPVSKLFGQPVFRVQGGRVTYRGAFESKLLPQKRPPAARHSKASLRP